MCIPLMTLTLMFLTSPTEYTDKESKENHWSCNQQERIPQQDKVFSRVCQIRKGLGFVYYIITFLLKSSLAQKMSRKKVGDIVYFIFVSFETIYNHGM